MRKLYKNFFLSPDDVGLRGCSVKEIAERMTRSEAVDQSALLEFAKIVRLFLEKDDEDNEKRNNQMD